MSHQDQIKKIENETDELLQEIDNDLKKGINPEIKAKNAKATLLELGAEQNVISTVLENKPTKTQEQEAQTSKVFKNTQEVKTQDPTSESKK